MTASPARSNPGEPAEEARVTPTAPSERIVALDALRGFAILGILIMNIQGFSMISAAYRNPTAYGDLSGLNRWVWVLSHLFADLKFMAIFSMLFGAGIVLMTDNVEKKGRQPAAVHYRRTFWLFVIGLAHAYLLWSGDILTIYALCALVVYLFRRRSPRLLLSAGLLAIAVPSVVMLFSRMTLPYWPPETAQGLQLDWQPTAGVVAGEIAAYRGGWLDQMAYRVPQAWEFHTYLFLIWFAWRPGGLMLLGMALYKWGVLTAQRSSRFYAWLAGIGFAVGLPIVAYGITRNFAAGWSFEYSMFHGSQFNYWASPLVSLGYIGLVMLVAKSGHLRGAVDRLAAVGRMALTNYLLQTVVCTLIFYGHGLGWFGQVERAGQALIVFAVWAIQLTVSPLWLRRFRFGPVEWLWRSLTYWQPQPMAQRRAVPSPGASGA